MNNLEAVEKVAERVLRNRFCTSNPTITVDDLLRVFRAYHSDVEGLKSGPEPELTLKPGDRCPACGWTVPSDMEHHDASTRMSPSRHVYATKPSEIKPKPDTLSEDDYRLLMLRGIWRLLPGDAENGELLAACEHAINLLAKAIKAR